MYTSTTQTEIQMLDNLNNFISKYLIEIANQPLWAKFIHLIFIVIVYKLGNFIGEFYVR